MRKISGFSLVETAFSLAILGVILLFFGRTVQWAQSQIKQARIEFYTEQIAVAAADFAFKNGYLPLPLGAAEPATNDPQAFLECTLRGEVPWEELGLQARPVVDGRPFLWVVAATAIKRPGCEYYAADHVQYMSWFWADDRKLTFARPSWCDEGYRNRTISCSPGGKHANSVLKYLTEQPRDMMYQYSVRPVKEGEYQDAPPRLSYLTPRLRDIGPVSPLLLPGVMRVHCLEMKVSFLPESCLQRKHSRCVSTTAVYFGQLCEERLSQEMLTDAFYARMKRAIWTNECVLAIAHGITDPPMPDNQLSVDSNAAIFTRSNLLGMHGCCDTMSYSHPGYTWVKLDEERVNDLNPYGIYYPCNNCIHKEYYSSKMGSFYFCKSSPFDTKATVGAILSEGAEGTESYSELCRDATGVGVIGTIVPGNMRIENPKTAILALSTCSADPVGNGHECDTCRCDHLVSEYLLQWLRSMMYMDGVRPLRLDGGHIVLGVYTIAVEIALYKAFVEAVCKTLEVIAEELEDPEC